jgi:hypothetical protein
VYGMLAPPDSPSDWNTASAAAVFTTPRDDEWQHRHLPRVWGSETIHNGAEFHEFNHASIYLRQAV